ncbi:MAG: hypothetical protein ACKVKL_04490 [Pseudomonadales bacterium]
MSLDEVAGLHETLNAGIDMSWVYPAAAMVFFCDAIGVELPSEDMDEEAFAYVVATAIEEGMEMIGARTFLFMSQEALKDSAA